MMGSTLVARRAGRWKLSVSDDLGRASSGDVSGLHEFGLKSQLVADSVDCQQVPGRVAVVAQFLSQLHDYLVQSARCAKIVVAPNFVQQTVPRHHLTWMRKK